MRFLSSLSRELDFDYVVNIAADEVDDPVGVAGFGIFLLEIEDAGVEGQRLLHVPAMDDGNRWHGIYCISPKDAERRSLPNPKRVDWVVWRLVLE